MREDAVDIYTRSRYELLKSVLDGEDYESSIANYAFASINLERHGYLLEKSWEDYICDSIIKEELSEDELEYLEELRGQLSDAKSSKDLDQVFEISDKMAELESKQGGRISPSKDSKQSKLFFRHGAEMQLPNHVMKGRFEERDIQDLSASWPNAPFKQGAQYADAHAFHKSHSPLRKKNTVTDRPEYIETLRSFYLPEAPGEKSLSEKYTLHEREFDRLHQKRENPAVVGISTINHQGHEIKHYPFLGTHDDIYLHDIYMNNFDEWKDANPEIVKKAFSDFSRSEDQDFALRQLHFEDAADGWESNDYHDKKIDPKNALTEQEIQDLAYGFGQTEHQDKPTSFSGDVKSLEPFQLKQGLGREGYMFGLEFYNPIQRHHIMEHLHKHGSDSTNAQRISLGDKTYTSAGRIKRNIAQRMTPEFLHHIRAQSLHGPNMHKHIESLKDHPKGEEFFLNHSLHQALMGTPFNETDDETIGYQLLDEINDMLFGLDEETEDKPKRGLLNIPSMSNKQVGIVNKEVKNMMKKEQISHNEALGEVLLGRDSTASHLMDMTGLMNLLGYDSEKKPIDGNHVLFPDVKGSMISNEKIDKILEEAKRLGKTASRQNDIRNADSFQYLGKNGPELDKIDPDEQDIWMMGKNGQPIGLGHHFAEPFHGQGGRGKSGMAYLEMLHDSLPKDENGMSLIGFIDKRAGNQFMPNPETLGMFGRFIPKIRDKDNLVHSGSHGIQSLWGASSFVKRGKSKNPKNTIFHGMTSLNGKYSNMVRYMTDKERKEFLGKSMGPMMYERGIFASNPLMAIGGLGQNTTQTLSNSRNSHNLATKLGRLYPPHAPANFTILKKAGMQSGKYKLSHSQGNIHAFNLHQGYYGHKTGESEASLSTEAKEEIEELGLELDDVSYRLNQEDTPEDEIRDLMQRQKELESTIQGIETADRKEVKIDFTKHFKEHGEKDEADILAITEMAKKLKPIMEEADPSAFDPLNPAKFLANNSRLFSDANRALLTLPQSYHGLSTYGYGKIEEERKSVSEILSEQTGQIESPHHTMAMVLAMAGKEIRPDMSREKILSTLGLPDNSEHQQLADRLMTTLDGPIKVLTHGDMLASGAQFHPTMDTSDFHGVEDHHEQLDGFDRNHPLRHTDKPSTSSSYKTLERQYKKDFNSKYTSKLRFLPMMMSRGYEKEGEGYGLEHLPLSVPHAHGKDENIFGKTTGNITGPLNKSKSMLHDLFIFNPAAAESMEKNIAPSFSQTVAKWDHGFPITPADTQGHSVQDFYTSGGMDSGYPMTPSVGIEFGGGKPVAGTNTSEEFLHSVQQPLMEALHGKDNVNTVLSSGYQVPQLIPNQFKTDTLGEAQSDRPINIALSDVSELLTVLMNPDALLKSTEGKPPPILPMHRIFSLKDFDSLRGFSGDWVVSAYYEGERIIIQRKAKRVTAYDERGDTVNLENEDRKQFRAISENNYIIDVIKTNEEFHVIDILAYDDTNIADMNVTERLKVLRGQFDSYEHILIPGPHNTRVTDEGGLAKTVESLSEEHNQILLRDSNSTYMRGERRHPKWFLLRADKKVSFIILDVRGKGPYTYRLGAGPVDEEGLENRGVDYEGKKYLDIGTINSPKPFKEGDVVKVSVSGVKSRKRKGRVIYDVTTSKIIGEGESEGPASLETLSLLTKSHPIIPVPFEIEYKNNKLIISFEDIDDVIYKMEQSHTGIWAHSPKSIIGALSYSDYPLLLAESVRPFWSQATSLMIKGVKKPSPKEDESAGILEDDDEEIILKPDSEKLNYMVKALEKIAELMDRIEKEQMTSTGARGLGIDVGSAIESPRGPTRLTTEQSLPDWDMKKRPTEDSEEEYPATKRERLKNKKSKQSIDFDKNDER